MPAIYTHDRFGQDVYQFLRGKEDSLHLLIKKNFDLFRIGLQGPDLLFYHQPLMKNPIKTYGTTLHRQAAFDFFIPKKELCQKSTEVTAYLLGFICHFVLDSQCHPYIENREVVTGLTHSEIEFAFEKLLLSRDNKDFYHYNPALSLSEEPIHGQIVGEALNLDPKVVLKSLSSMKSSSQYLLENNPISDYLVILALKISNNYQRRKGMLASYPVDASCTRSNRKLMELYGSAIPVAIELMNNFLAFTNGNAELGERFKKDYSGV